MGHRPYGIVVSQALGDKEGGNLECEAPGRLSREEECLL